MMSSPRKILIENSSSVQWNSGNNVVNVRSVVNPVNNKLKNGDTLTESTQGKEEGAPLLAHARERNAHVIIPVKTEDTPGPSGQGRKNQDGEEFTSDHSELVPNYNSVQSCGSYTEVKTKNIKLELYKRQYSRSKKNVLTPSNKANAVPVNNVNNKKTHDVLMDVSKNSSEPHSTKLNQTIEQRMHEKRLKEVTEINDTFYMLFQSFHYMKGQELSAANTDFKESTSSVTPPLNLDDGLNGSSSQLNQPAEENKENEINKHEEFKRPYDVLITKKSSDVGEKTVRRNVAVEEEWIPIGSGKTLIHKDKFKKINWKSYTIATRTLLVATFPRRVLATHSLTGKSSPAFKHKPAKMCLDPKITSDVIIEVVQRFNVPENLVRNIITTKCADECKMWKMRKNKKKALKTKENSATVQDRQ